MLRDKSILCFSTIDWGFLWQGHQEIMAALAEQGNRVLFIENTGVRAPVLRDLPRLRQRIRNWRRGVKGFRQERENLFVYSPVILPFPYSRLARWVNRILLGRSLRRWMRAARSTPCKTYTNTSSAKRLANPQNAPSKPASQKANRAQAVKQKSVRAEPVEA